MAAHLHTIVEERHGAPTQPSTELAHPTPWMDAAAGMEA